MITMRCLSWRRRSATPTFEMRGRASLHLVELGIVLRGVSVSRFYSGNYSAEMPTASRPRPDGSLETILCGTFTDFPSRHAFARQAWCAVLGVFPDAETMPMNQTVWALSPHRSKELAQ